MKLGLFSTDSQNKDFWLVDTSSYFNLVDPLQTFKPFYSVTDQRL